MDKNGMQDDGRKPGFMGIPLKIEFADKTKWQKKWTIPLPPVRDPNDITVYHAAVTAVAQFILTR